MRRGENFKNTYDIPNGHLITGLIKAENKKGPLNLNVGHAFYLVTCSVCTL